MQIARSFGPRDCYRVPTRDGVRTLSHLPSSTLTLIVYFVLADPSVEKRLREDLKEATAKYPAEVPRWADLEKIPYLAGCIKEGLRYMSSDSILLDLGADVVPSSLARLIRRSPRISPDQDLIFKQWVMPKNVSFACVAISSFDVAYNLANRHQLPCLYAIYIWIQMSIRSPTSSSPKGGWATSTLA